MQVLPEAKVREFRDEGGAGAWSLPRGARLEAKDRKMVGSGLELAYRAETA